MNYTLLLHLLIKVFLLIVLGYFLKKRNGISEEFEDGLSNLLMKVIMPFSVLGSSNTELSAHLLKNIGFICILAFFYYLFTLLILKWASKRLHAPEQKKTIFIMMSVFANTGFLGFPIMTELYGSEGLLYAVIYNLFYQLFFFTYGTYLVSGDKKLDVKGIVKNPVNLSLVAAIALLLLQIPIPAALSDTFASLAGMMVPISMILIGCSLAKVSLLTIFEDRTSYYVSFLRLLLFPLLMLGVTMALGLEKPICIAATLMTALPSGSLNVIIAKQYHCEPDYAARTVVQCMIFSIFTIPLMIYLCNLILAN